MSWTVASIRAALCFLAGSVPFSYLLVRAFKGEDIRDYGEGNPGAANAAKAAGPFVGLTAVLLDGFKGLFPAYFLSDGASYWQVPLISIAPVLGHAFSPFLRFRGGKAIATTFGVWTALTLWEAPSAMGLGGIVAAIALRKAPDIAKYSCIFLFLAAYLLIMRKGADMWLLFALNFAVVLAKTLQYEVERRRHSG